MNFKSIFKKQNILPVAVLLAICIVIAAILGGVNMLTEEKIEANEQQKVYESIKEALDGYVTPMDKPENAADSVTGMYKITVSESDATVLGTVVTVKVRGYAGDIFMTVGVKSDKTISKVIITSQSESHGKAGMADYPDKFTGISTSGVGGVELFTGATISSTAIRNGVIDAVNAATGDSVSAAPDSGSGNETEKLPSPKTDEQLIALASEMVKNNKGFTDITPDEKYKPASLYKLLKEKDGLGYVAYIVTTGWGGSLATESLVYIDKEGNIADHDILTWNVGHGVEPGTFGDRFIGLDLWNVDKVELVADCTGTSGGVKSAITEALECVTKQIPRSEEKLLDIINRSTPSLFGFESVELSSDAPKTLKKLFKETSGDGYVAYLLTEGWGGSIATEALLYVDANGCVRNLDILIWNVGHGIGPGDFASRFKGKDLEALKWGFDPENEDGIDLVAGCTGTSGDLKDAVLAALEYMPGNSSAARIIGLVALFGSFAAVVGIVVYKKIKRRDGA